ncbi:MAG: hypothetical protein JXR89_09705 [Deltaproteobacteria bacterium]|nr:hypothetical protein [Deltaproteobacteria bacterium]
MKSVENIKLMKKVLVNELNRLPKTNFFGDSNAEEREKLHGWIIDLSYIENFGRASDPDSEVAFWCNDECWSPLCEYEQDLEDFAEHEQLLRYAAWLNM